MEIRNSELLRVSLLDYVRWSGSDVPSETLESSGAVVLAGCCVSRRCNSRSSDQRVTSKMSVEKKEWKQGNGERVDEFPQEIIRSESRKEASAERANGCGSLESSNGRSFFFGSCAQPGSLLLPYPQISDPARVVSHLPLQPTGVFPPSSAAVAPSGQLVRWRRNQLLVSDSDKIAR